MNKFFKNLFSNSDSTSHKRFIAISAFLILILMVILKAAGCDIDEDLVYVFAGLTGGQSLLSVVDKQIAKRKE